MRRRNGPTGAAPGTSIQAAPDNSRGRTAHGSRGTAFGALRHADFRMFWTGFGVAMLGFQIQRVGLGFLAYDITGSALYLALVFSGDSIPMIVLSPLGGVIGDRVNRRLVLIVSRSCVAVLALAVAVLTATGMIETWHLLLFALLTGICYAIDVPARQAMLNDLVPRDELVNAIALTATLRQASRIIGPAIGGVALLVVGVQGTFGLMAAAQLSTVLMVMAIRLPHVPRLRQGSVSADLAQGFRFIAGHRIIRVLMLVSAAPALTAMAYQTLTPVFAVEVLGQGGSAIGVMLAAAGVGALAGSMLVTGYPARMSTPTVAIVAAMLFGLVVAAFALSRHFGLSVALLVAAGLTNAVYTIGVSSAIQRRTPPGDAGPRDGGVSDDLGAPGGGGADGRRAGRRFRCARRARGGRYGKRDHRCCALDPPREG